MTTAPASTDTPLLATPGTFAVQTLGPLTTMLCLRAIMDGVDVAGQGLNAEAGLDRLAASV